MRTRIGSPFLLTIISIFSILFFATSVAAQRINDTVGNTVLCEPIPQSTIGVGPGGADREPVTELEKVEHRFFSIHPELFPDTYVTGTHINIIEAYNKSGCNLQEFGKRYPELTPVGFFEDLKGMNGSAPPVGSSSGMPPVGGQSPAQNALALAQAAKLAAEQQVNTAQGTLESAQSAVQTAQQTLTTAQETLASATSALQEAEDAVEKENQQKDELIRVAKQAVQEAEQNLQTAQQELDSARSALQELEQQIATAQGTVTTAEGKQQELNTLLLQAQAEVARLMGNSSGMPPMGNSSGLPLNPDGTTEVPVVTFSPDSPLRISNVNSLCTSNGDGQSLSFGLKPQGNRIRCNGQFNQTIDLSSGDQNARRDGNVRLKNIIVEFGPTHQSGLFRYFRSTNGPDGQSIYADKYPGDSSGRLVPGNIICEGCVEVELPRGNDGTGKVDFIAEYVNISSNEDGPIDLLDFSFIER